MWVAELDVLVGVPGDAVPVQGDVRAAVGPVGRVGSVVLQSEGVWEVPPERRKRISSGILTVRGIAWIQVDPCRACVRVC